MREAFADNLAARGEIGAACTAYVDGRCVVDLHGGHRDAARTRPWTPDTLANFYSVGKPIVALLALQLVECGELDLDAPVARYWPEFGAAGKADATVRAALSHRAGVPALRERLRDDAMLDWDCMTRALARTRPWWVPGTRHVYHTNTYGFLVGELVRRLTGERPGARLRACIADPLEADVAFGIGSADLGRCAEIVFHGPSSPPSFDEVAVIEPEEQRMVALGYFNPPGFSGIGVVNTAPWRLAEIPSTNGHGTARGIARIYDALARADARVLAGDVLAEATREQSSGPCPVLEVEVSFGLGFQVTRPDRPIGRGAHTFGHYGTGGALGFADPDARLGFGYVMNRVVPRWRNECNRALVEAVYDALG